jgi:hypothetical protein
MNSEQKITIIIPFFGKLPCVASLFFFSCRYNKNLHFLLFTDQPKPKGLPSNVEYYSFSLQGFNQLASMKLGQRINIRYPYKLCDFKPMYGIIWEEYLYDSTFWGYCDMDLIFGDSKEFLTKDLLDNFDVITARKDSLAGNFTLYKNNDVLKQLFYKSDSWEKIVQNSLWVHSFPEKFKSKGRPVSNNLFYRLKKSFFSPHINKCMIPDMNVVLNNHSEIKVHYGNFMLSDIMLKNRGINNWSLNWKNGILSEKTTEHHYLFFHFYFLKNQATFQVPKSIEIQDIKSLSITFESIKINH